MTNVRIPRLLPHKGGLGASRLRIIQLGVTTLPRCRNTVPAAALRTRGCDPMASQAWRRRGTPEVLATPQLERGWMQKRWCPQRDSNPRYRLEGPMSWASLDDGGAGGRNGITVAYEFEQGQP